RVRCGFSYVRGCCGVLFYFLCFLFFFSSRRRHTRFSRDWSSDVCSSDLVRQRIGLSEPPAVRRRHTCEYVAWRLGWSARWAQAQLELADALLTRFPDVFAAVHEGRLDPARAAAFVELLSDVDDEATVQWIVDRLLPKAPGWTLAELRERLRYHVHRRAPQAAQRRGQKRVVARDVQLQP